MPVTTFLSEQDLNKPVSNPHLNELLQEVRQGTGDDWQLRESIYTYYSWWDIFKRKPKVKKFYSVLVHAYADEYQIIQLYHEDNDHHYYRGATAEQASAYLYGILGGDHAVKARLKHATRNIQETWVDLERVERPIKDMTDLHVRNALALVIRNLRIGYNARLNDEGVVTFYRSKPSTIDLKGDSDGSSIN